MKKQINRDLLAEGTSATITNRFNIKTKPEVKPEIELEIETSKEGEFRLKMDELTFVMLLEAVEKFGCHGGSCTDSHQWRMNWAFEKAIETTPHCALDYAKCMAFCNEVFTSLNRHERFLSDLWPLMKQHHDNYWKAEQADFTQNQKALKQN